ncbi:MAG: S9 family peptidase, partial [Clostridia bacterium]
ESLSRVCPVCNGRGIVFARDIGGNEQNNLFHLNLATGEVRQLNDDPASQEYAGPVSPDGSELLVLSNREGQVNLFALDLASLGWRKLTDFPAPVASAHWSPDGRRVAFAANATSNLKNFDVYLMNRDGSGQSLVFRSAEGATDVVTDWSADGRYLALTSDHRGYEQAGILNADTGTVRWLGDPGSKGGNESSEHFSHDGTRLVVMENHDATLLPVLYDVESGVRVEPALPPGVVSAAEFVLGGTALVVAQQTTDRRVSVSLCHLANDTPNHAVEEIRPAFYGSFARDAFVRGQAIRYPSTDGVTVPAILYRPTAAPPPSGFPALVMAHGGPTGQFWHAFDLYAQLLTRLGYVVLQPNVRGSTGYGVSWRDACIEDWGGKDLDDVVAAAAYLRAQTDVDPERLGIFGGSYGGYMSYMAVTKTPSVFQVGIPMYGISDLPALYAESMDHFKYYLRQQMGDPDERGDLWRDRSGVTRAADVRAKLLILHGLNDPRCPASQGRLFRDALIAAGKRMGTAPDDDFEYHEFDEGHGAGGDVAGKLRDFELIVDFLQRRL